MTRTSVVAFLALALLAAPPAAQAQPALEQFRFDPPQLCLRDVFQWGFSYHGIPGGLAAVRDLAMEGVFEGRTVRSPLTPMKRGPSALRRRSGAVQKPPPPLAEEAGEGRDRIPVHAACCPRRRTGGLERDVGALRGRLSAARALRDARRRLERSHRPPDHHADDPRVPPGDQARRHDADLGRPRASPGAGRAEPGGRARSRLRRGGVLARTAGPTSFAGPAPRRSSSIASRAGASPSRRRTRRSSAAWR